jgi:hypothetical protein
VGLNHRTSSCDLNLLHRIFLGPIRRRRLRFPLSASSARIPPPVGIITTVNIEIYQPMDTRSVRGSTLASLSLDSSAGKTKGVIDGVQFKNLYIMHKAG